MPAFPDRFSSVGFLLLIGPAVLDLLSIPEVASLDTLRDVIRIPPGTDVPITPRIRQLIDCREFQRLTRIRQLGLVGLVYPAAHHTRFEHSLGVYRTALEYLRQLRHDERFTEAVESHDAEVFLVAALLHDLGHWPYCHPIEDMALPGVPQHEMFANSFLLEGEVADALRDAWGMQPREVVDLLSAKPRDRASRVLKSMLSGPIDIDKMDYLFRDSLHAGVPYGQHFDRNRLIGSLCLNKTGDRLAITHKGRTAAELMVFARYVMFSEVYWHHAVRSATAMWQRAFFLLYAQLDLDELFRGDEAGMIRLLREAAEGGPASDLLDGLFGNSRVLYKRLRDYHFLQHPQMHQALARRPYAELVACAEQLADRLSKRIGCRIAPHEILIDAPPVGLEVEFDLDIYVPKEDRYYTLADLSPVVQTLARRQFDDYVKRVRIFVHPRLCESLENEPKLEEQLRAVLAEPV